LKNATRSDLAFERCNLFDAPLEQVRAHGGAGQIYFCRIVTASRIAGACNFVDYSELPPGTSIGIHQHQSSEEEYYLVLSGEGELHQDGHSFVVKAGDLVRNGPGGTHGLRNTGSEPLRLFVFELQVR